MSASIKVTECAGLSWLCLWAFLILLTLGRMNIYISDIAESQRRIAASYPEFIDPNVIPPLINYKPVEKENEKI